jgi:catechol 2,3-dioxygenase-like lactoylglutathione lyase family enzyme
VSSELVCTVIETGDPDGLARFWCTALGWQVIDRWVDAHGTAFVEVGPDRPRLLFQQSSTARSGGQRVHLDIRPVGTTQAAEVRRLVDAGAEIVDDDPAVGWVVLRDPDHAVFCVLTPDERPDTTDAE